MGTTLGIHYMKSQFRFFAYTSALFIFCTVSLKSNAETVSYKIEKAGYVNSLDGLVEASCRPGETLIKGSCDGRLRAISVPRSERLPFPFDKGFDEAPVTYPLATESEGQTFRCRPKMLRPEQHLMLFITAVCKPSQT